MNGCILCCHFFSYDSDFWRRCINRLRSVQLILRRYRAKMGDGNIELTQYPGGGVFAYEIIQKEGFREIYEWYAADSRALIWKVMQNGDIVEFHDDDTSVRYENRNSHGKRIWDNGISVYNGKRERGVSKAT